jgi:flagellin-like protein
MHETHCVLHVAESAATRAYASRTRKPEFEPWRFNLDLILDFFCGKLPVYLQVVGHLRWPMRRERVCEDEAVSPVIATVLLMAITVLLASAVYLMVDDAIAAPDKGAPYATMSVRALDNGFQVVRFTELSQNLHTSSVTFSIVPPVGVNGSSIDGRVNDANVYGSIGETVTFHDRDASFTVNRGDYFVINATAAGTDEGGWTIFIRSEGNTGATTELAAMPLPATI